MAFEFMEVLPVMTMQLAHAGLNLFVAACLGAAIGLERQWRQRLAGLRTNTLVALGAAIFVTYSHVAPDGAGDTRIAAQVVSGIGFLGAGVIFKEGLAVRGSQHRRDPLVLGGGRPARRRSACPLRPHGGRLCAWGEHSVEADRPRH
jgi:MgtC family